MALGAVAAAFPSGCTTENAHKASSGVGSADLLLNLRQVTRTSSAACEFPALREEPAGSACSFDGRTRYELGPDLGDLRVSNAEVDSQSAAVLVSVDQPSRAKFAAVTGQVAMSGG
jgi:hypothetical protein